MRQAFDQSMGPELAQIVAEGAQRVMARGEFKGIEDGAAQFLAAPPAQRTGPSAEEDLEQAHHPDLVQANASNLAFLEWDRFSQTG